MGSLRSSFSESVSAETRAGLLDGAASLLGSSRPSRRSVQCAARSGAKAMTRKVSGLWNAVTTAIARTAAYITLKSSSLPIRFLSTGSFLSHLLPVELPNSVQAMKARFACTAP